MSTNINMDAAIEYATKYGWAVFPVDPGTKRPKTTHGCKDAKKDVGAIKAWWKRYPEASVGIATGPISELVVIDIDKDHERNIYGFESLCDWEKIHGKLPDTVMCTTGRGGSHRYYHYTGDDIGNRAGLLDGVDVRGTGGYVIAPPSLHMNGSYYEWEAPPEETELAELDDLVRLLLSEGMQKGREQRFELPQTIPAGERNDTLYKLACSLQAQGLEDNAIYAAVAVENATKCDQPLDEKELTTLIKSALRHQKGELKAARKGMPEYRQPKIDMIIDKDGNITEKPAQTVHNAEEAVLYDEALFGRIRYNELSYSINVYGVLPWKEWRGWREWDNNDDLNLWGYVERQYGIKDQSKIVAATSNIAHKFIVNPVKEFLQNALENWDGNRYVEKLLPKYAGARQSEYTTAVLRLQMLGAVSRIFKPGCKYDYILILVGEQGTYKSSFVRFLAVSEEWLHDNFNSLEGDKAFEKLRGKWMIELSELQATKRARDVEVIKAFITSQNDDYRPAYGRRSERHPRQCVFFGTSNTVDFLTDRTGNRRFLPIMCGQTPPMSPWDNEDEAKYDFTQAWGEIMDEYTRGGGRVRLVLPKDIEQEAQRIQQEFLEDDPTAGLIQEWLDKCGYDLVCALQIYREALGHEYGDPQRYEINDIHDIMQRRAHGWKKVGKQRCGGYGIQRCYRRVEKDFIKTTRVIPFV